MGDFLRVLLEMLHFVWPLRNVRSYQQAVYMHGGGVPKLLLPRRWPYPFWPFWDEIEILDVLPDVMDLPLQTVTTADDQSVTISANVVFHITDITKHFTNVQDFHENLPRMASRHIAAKVRTWTWEELRTRQSELERSLRDTMNTRIARLDWGAEVDDVGITDLVKPRTYRVIQG